MTRRSRREIEHTLEKIHPAEYDAAPLCILLSAEEIQPVAGQPDLLEIDGELWKKPPADVMRRLGV